jgi:MFS transporter, DHA1 family, tetracycline resistance protein
LPVINHMKKHSHLSKTFIFLTVVIDIIGLGIIIPVVPKLIQSLTGEDLSGAAQWGGLLIFSFAAMQFIFSPIIGGLSDQYGRRPVLLLALTGMGVDYLFSAFAPTLSWLFVGRMLAGITGASFTTAMAYMADISAPEDRSKNFGLLGAAFGVGFIIGPALGGMLSQFGPKAPFFASAILSFANAIFGYFVLPESLKPEFRRPFNWKRANPVGSLMQIKKYPNLLRFFVAYFFLYVAAHAVQTTWSYYTMKKFLWDEKTVGYSLALVGVCIALVQGGLSRIWLSKFGNIWTVRYGFLLYAFILGCFGFANSGWLMLALCIPFAIGGSAGPAAQGLMSNMIPANAQGELQGALTSLMSLTSILGPIIMTQLFAYFTRPESTLYLPGAPFFLGSILVFTCWIILQPGLRHIENLKSGDTT